VIVRVVLLRLCLGALRAVFLLFGLGAFFFFPLETGGASGFSGRGGILVSAISWSFSVMLFTLSDTAVALLYGRLFIIHKNWGKTKSEKHSAFYGVFD
jgi:hypothetical protein